MLDMGLYKSFRLGKGHSVALRAQAFNLLNYVQYGFPSVDFSTPSTFGRITSTATGYLPRTVQINVWYRF